MQNARESRLKNRDSHCEGNISMKIKLLRGFISRWLPGRRDLLVSMLPGLQALANYTVGISERTGVPELDPFGCRRTRTTRLACAPPVGQEDRHLPYLCSGTRKLQRWARCLRGRRDIPVPIRTTSRPGGLSYRAIACIETGGGTDARTKAQGAVPGTRAPLKENGARCHRARARHKLWIDGKLQ